MSYILAMINLKSQIIENAMFESMLSACSKYVVDRTESLVQSNIALACGLLEVTPESAREYLPYYDEENGFLITADAIIDNRNDLIKELDCIDKGLSDSQLILMAYKRWEHDCVKHLIGEFAFLIHDLQKGTTFVAKDPMGCRSLYYATYLDYILVSTTIEPLKSVMGNSLTLDDQWFADFLSLRLNFNEIDTSSTHYKEIYQIPPAHYMIVNESGAIDKTCYWKLDLKELLNLGNEQEYEKKLYDALNEAVCCRLRTRDGLGLMLSSGLDSTAIGCLAAEELKKSKRSIKAYTSVPVEAFEGAKTAWNAFDETEYILPVLKKYTNISHKRISVPDKNPYDSLVEMLSIVESPYKMVVNSHWSLGILEEAKNDGCKVILNGQFGNYTISQGDTQTYLNWLILK